MIGLVLIVGAAALTECDTPTLDSEAAEACYQSVAMTATDDGVRAEALWRAGDVAGANAAFRLAVAQRPGDAALRARWGGLFLDVHQDADAQALFTEALELEADQIDALLGMARLSLGRFEPGVQRYVGRVLQQQPRNPDAHLLLARLELELGEVARARSTLERLLADGVFEGRERLSAYALLAAADALEGVNPSPWVGKALAVNARFAEAHAVPAHHFVINRRYREAVARYQQAVAVAPRAWDAHAELGINLLRLDRLEAARRHLEIAYEGDPYNALTVNTLRLLDLLESGFDTVRDPGLLMRAPADQAAALAPHVRELASRAADEMSARYGYRPEEVVIELYGHHDDFAVRTAGLPGLGILGATFGDVVVMDGPAARTSDDGFDWLSAVWHELGHVYTLGATDNRVSRWLSEGISVMEEWDHGPTPQQAMPLHFLDAMAEGRLLPVADLDEGFLRPRYPQQIAISYLQAGLLCQLIARDFEQGLAAVLEAYAQGADTVGAIRQGLGLEPVALDERFGAYLDTRFGAVVASLDAFRAARQAAWQAVEAEVWDAALTAGQRAVALYPAYVQTDSPYLAVARGADGLGDTATLDRTLADYVARGGRDGWALGRLAERHQVAGRPAAALEVRSLQVGARPLDPALVLGLGDAQLAAGRYEAARVTFEGLLALEPHDRAGAYLRLAQAWHGLGDTAAARRAVLQALEIAPRYDAALNLLVTLNGASADHE